jgi:hypothetical protein
MEPLSWGAVAGLMLKYGPEVADFIVRKWNARGTVTLQEWESLQALANKTPESQVRDALARAGIPENDPRALEILAALPKP